MLQGEETTLQNYRKILHCFQPSLRGITFSWTEKKLINEVFM